MSRNSAGASHSSEGLLRVCGPLLSIGAEDSPVFVAAARLRSMRAADPAIRYASGWGASWPEAAERCRLEAAERCSAQFTGNEPLKRAALADLGSAAVTPPQLLLISPAQYEQRSQWNRSHPGLSAVPQRWREDRALDWIACDPRLSSQTAWLPAGLCLLGHSRDRPSGLPPAESSGVAAGTSLEDAALRAFLELVERDAAAIWWYGRLARPRLNWQSIADPLVASYAHWCAGRGRILKLLDLTHDFRIPVAAAVAHDSDGGCIAFGLGVGSSVAEAARHAVGELAQCEGNLLLIEERALAAGLRGLSPEARALLRWWRTARLSELRHLVGEPPERKQARRSARVCLEDARSLCDRRGLPFLVLDLTRSGIRVPVARVVVPGLRPLRARFAPGRLYDVPVQLGWRRRRLLERSLNPIPLMI